MHRIFNVAIVYVCALTLTFTQTMPAYAGLIGTDQLVNQQMVDQDRETLRNVLDRGEVRSLLEKHGVTNVQAQERINAMTDAEVRVLAQRFEELPAAGDFGVVAAVLIIVLLFIALELSGQTNIFKGL